VRTEGTRIHCSLQDQVDLVEQEIQDLLREFWHATNSDDLRMESCIDREAANFKSSVSKGRTPPCGVRYTRKKLPLASHRGGTENDS
jgi:hypothetical protein